MNTTNTKQIHQLIGVIIALEGMLDTVDDGLIGVRNVLARIASEETADAQERAETTPEHPEHLESEEGYKAAPEGTVVAADGDEAYMKRGGWIRGDEVYGSPHMAAMPRRVLRWGWEA